MRWEEVAARHDGIERCEVCGSLFGDDECSNCLTLPPAVCIVIGMESVTETKVQQIDDMYDADAPLVTIIREVGTDDASLRLIRSRIGTSMNTLRRVADEINAA